MEHISPECQKLVTTLQEAVQPFWTEISAQITENKHSLLTPLDSSSRPLCIATIPTDYKKTTIVIPDQTFSLEITTLKQWSSLLQSTTKTITLPYPLSEQELDGSIQTDTSLAWHTWLLAHIKDQSYRLLVSEKTATTPLPNPTAYRNQCLELVVGQTQPREKLLEQLVTAGYIRHQTSLEPGSFRARGEQIDISHPTINGYLSILLFGNAIEQIVHHQNQRSQTISYYLLPPVTFSNDTTSWSQINADLRILLESPLKPPTTPTIVTSATANSDLNFPIQPIAQSDIAESKGHTFIVFQDTNRLQKYRSTLSPQEQEQLTVCNNSLAQIPLHLTTNNWSLRTEASIYPPQQDSTSPISSARAQELLGQLEPGKPAVHADHGIGLYQGLQTKTINGISREYLLLQYAAGDSIATPVAFAHKVSPYVGADNPPIHRLGGTSWATTKRKAKADALKFAKELLKTGKKRYQSSRPAYFLDPTVENQLDQSFPFDLTSDQERTWQEIISDLTNDKPMDRLIVGDVGFGKTELALRAARHVVANGKQVAVLAPTTLLVQQHFDTFQNRLSDIKTDIHLLSRFISAKDQKATKQATTDGTASIAIGTHALLSASTQWKDLGLIIIDEEQRFGVKQKEHFKKLRASVDILSLSATPIPRTLSQALSGLRDLSIISTPPKGRKAVTTHVKKVTDDILATAIRTELERDGQVYLVAPKIRHLAKLKEEAAALVPNGRYAIAHGRLPDDQLAKIIHDFDAGNINVLVCSSIVENGLDLPKANTMIIYHAPNFGLSELYQLRGRVGRRQRQGHAYFLYNQDRLTTLQRQRLAAITEASRLGSGWELARRDLEIRGAGNLLGAEQSGSVNSVGAALYLDMIRQAVDQEDADQPITEEVAIDVDVTLPFPTIIPLEYIQDDTQRVRWYGRLARTKTTTELKDLEKQLIKEHGPLPDSTQNLILATELAHAATPYKIMAISSQTIEPSDEDPYHRLVITTTDPKPALQKLGQMGNWQVRGYDLTWDIDQITPEIIEKIIQTLKNK